MKHTLQVPGEAMPPRKESYDSIIRSLLDAQIALRTRYNWVPELDSASAE